MGGDDENCRLEARLSKGQRTIPRGPSEAASVVDTPNLPVMRFNYRFAWNERRFYVEFTYPTR
jgi:hypothetical protein